MAKYKVIKLSGEKLDAAVELANGAKSIKWVMAVPGPYPESDEWEEPDPRCHEGAAPAVRRPAVPDRWGGVDIVTSYGTSWCSGGPIVDREWRPITAQLFDWFGTKWRDSIDGKPGEVLRWLMRAYVASKLGEEVELP